MKNGWFIALFLWGTFLTPSHTHAQEEEPEIGVEQSAEVFLEDYSDDFQESFFEALKQKGIENYDRAINLLLECKRLDASNKVVDHELAKVYFEDKQYPLAQEYAVVALASEPGNLWYLDTLVEVIQKQGGTISGLATEIDLDHVQLNENLAWIYFKNGNYENALKVLKKVKRSTFAEDLASKINDSIKKRETESENKPFSAAEADTVGDGLNRLEARINELIDNNDLPLLLQLSEEALENYPAQPYFYYANGYALNRMAKHREAVSVLEAGLDYMLDDVSLSNKMYKELSEAYAALNNSVKANMYLRKIKPGF